MNENYHIDDSLNESGLNENEEEKSKSKGIYSRATFLILLLTSILFYVDFGPPLPPYYPWFKTDDCYSLKMESFSNNNGILNFTFYADETYELPREYLPNLIKIRAISDVANVTYFGARFSNRTQNGSFVNIVVPHHFISSFDFLITCLDDMKLAEFHQNITKIDDKYSNMMGSSKSTQIGPKEELFEHVCIEGKTSFTKSIHLSNTNSYTLSFFSYLNEKHKPFQFGQTSKKSKNKFNTQLDFKCAAYNYFEFISSKNIKSERGDFIFSPALDENLWQLILFDLPEIENVRVWANFDDYDLIVPKHKSSTSILNQEIYDIEELQCFDSISVANFHPNILVNQKEDNQFIWEALDQNFSNFRAKYISSSISNSAKIILISDDVNLLDLKKIIENICIKSSADCSVLTYNHTTFDKKLSELMSKANILIGNHITNLAPMAMMNSGTQVIDFSNKRYSCNNWAKKFAQKFDIHYYSYYGNNDRFNGKCECFNFSKCYPEFPEKVEIDNIDNIKNLLLNILT